MSLTVSAGSQGSFEIVPEGTYIGRCFKIIDLGTQTSEWQGEKKQQKKVLVCWELLDDEVRMDDGRPFSVAKKYTASLHEKAQLRKDLEAWRGKKFTDEELEGFDLKNVMGVYCMIQVVHSTDGQYANINAIMSTKEKPVAVNPNVYFDVSEPDMEVFDSLSDRLKEQITVAPEWRVSQLDENTDTVAEVEDKSPIELDEMPDGFLK